MAAVSSTVEFQPSVNLHRRLLVEVPSDSKQVTDQDLRNLLRRRLRFLCPLVAAMYVMAVGLVVLDAGLAPVIEGDWQTWTVIVLAVLPSLCAGLVWSRAPLSLLQLRSVELVLVALLATRIAIRGYLGFWHPLPQGEFQRWRESGDPEVLVKQLNDSANFLCFTAATFIVAYGVCIPNTWRRCVMVVAALWSIPCLFWVAGVASNGLVGIWTRPLWLSAFTQMTFAAALAVYGSHRIETLRHTAMQARRLGQYHLKRRLGAGGMGEVFLGQHVLLRRPCAIKLIHPDRAGDPTLLERFEREVHATATLTHPNAVQVFDYGRAGDGTFYYVMEYLPGLTLDDLVKRHGPLPIGRVVHFLRQVCDALAEAHSIGLIHRDVKPGNVMVCQRGGLHDVAKLLDFGLVQTHVLREADERLTQQGAVIGTPAYLSPEQAGSGDTVDVRSDVYSVGALAYFVVTWRPPFAERTPIKMIAAHLYESPAPLTNHRSDVPPELESIILKCLAKKPTDRFADIPGLAAALAGCENGARWTAEDAANWWRSHVSSEIDQAQCDADD